GFGVSDAVDHERPALIVTTDDNDRLTEQLGFDNDTGPEARAPAIVIAQVTHAGDVPEVTDLVELVELEVERGHRVLGGGHPAGRLLTVEPTNHVQVPLLPFHLESIAGITTTEVADHEQRLVVDQNRRAEAQDLDHRVLVDTEQLRELARQRHKRVR